MKKILGLKLNCTKPQRKVSMITIFKGFSYLFSSAASLVCCFLKPIINQPVHLDWGTFRTLGREPPPGTCCGTVGRVAASHQRFRVRTLPSGKFLLNRIHQLHGKDDYDEKEARNLFYMKRNSFES